MLSSRLYGILCVLFVTILGCLYLATVLSGLVASIAAAIGSLDAICTLIFADSTVEPITFMKIAKLCVQHAWDIFSLVFGYFPWLVVILLALLLAAFLASLIFVKQDPAPAYESQDFSLGDFREEVKTRGLEAQTKGFRMYQETFLMSTRLKTHKERVSF